MSQPGDSICVLENVMKLRTSLLWVAAWISSAVCLLPHTVTAQDADIRVLCSNGIKAAMEKLIPEYERTSGHRINIQFGASATLKTSIEHGEPYENPPCGKL